MVSRMLLETEKHFQFLELQENQNVGKALIVTVVEANLVDDRHRMNLKFEVEKLTTEIKLLKVIYIVTLQIILEAYICSMLIFNVIEKLFEIYYIFEKSYF